MDGYQIIVPGFIDSFLQRRLPEKLLIPILLWMINDLRKEFLISEELDEIILIKVQYLGSYPAIGITNKSSINEELENKIETKCNIMINNLSFLDFHQFLIQNFEEINNEIKKFYEE